MIHYSISTVGMAVITSNILLILVTVLFQNQKLMINTGYKLLALFIGLTVLRFLLPFELPFTSTVLLTEFESVSQIIASLRHYIFSFGSVELSIWRIFELIWLTGFLINLLHYIQLHRKARYFILANSLEAGENEPFHSLLERICRERGRKNPFRVLIVSGINTPMIYGIFAPRILIPENLELTEEEWYYVLSHEASHHFRHDLFIKTLAKIITMIYWWNPAGYVLNKQIDVVLEMRVDNIVAAFNRETIIKYLHCLTELGERATEENVLPKAVTLSLLTKENSSLIQRYHMLISAIQKKSHVVKVLSFILIFGIYAASHLFIFEADYTPPKVAEESVAQSEDNTYAILKSDGTYDIYFEGYLIETTDSLEYFSSDIPIYTEKEFTNEEH